MTRKSVVLQNEHIERFTVASSDSPSHMRGLEPRRDAHHQGDQ